MVREFRDFILRGNVIELAVAIVIGSAFTALVQSFVDSVIAPIVATAGGTNVQGLAYQLVDGNDASVIDLGAVVSATIAFLVTALVVFFVFVKPMNALAARLARGEAEPPPAKAEDVALLEEIRDLLRAQSSPR